MVPDDFQCERVSLFKIQSIRGHMCSMIAFNLEAIARDAPTVSFVHDYPGFVDTGIFEKTGGMLAATIRGLSKIFGSRNKSYVPIEECGERHLFLATSARYEPATREASGVPSDGGITAARGSDGKVGSGVYIIDENGDSAGPEVVKLLSQMRENGMGERVQRYIEDQFRRIAT